MKSQLIDEIIACLPHGKTHYRYFKGAYAPRMLSLLIPDKISLHDLKRTQFSKLLEHKLVKQVIANCGSGELKLSLLDDAWLEPSQAFLLSLSRWGGRQNRGWYQTSRFGENLVLQLNLPLDNQRQFDRWIDPSGEGSLNGQWTPHPVQMKKDNDEFRDTLAWSRIDLDFNSNEALIEEIQSDSVRDVQRWARYYNRCKCQNCIKRLNYVEWFAPYSKIWSEAMLMATIWFIKNELGIERIYFHTARSGWQIKKMNKTWHPPRSLYSDLPRKFAFKKTYAAPEFLLKAKCYQQLIRKQPDIDFYQLSMDALKISGANRAQLN